ncbi:MAG: ABC transporter permease [Gemmatimonadota bacterium]|nr:ABC transporter permease [Gemmatimonadota bacterium]
MIKNYVLVLIRNFKRNTIYAAINILGLAIGLACCIDIGFYIHHEMSFDRLHKNGDRIYRILRETGDRDNRIFTISCPSPLGAAIRENLPGISKVVRLMNPDNPPPVISYRNKKFYEENFYFVDTDFLNVFGFQLLAGDNRTVLSEPFSTVIAESVSKKYFGNENPIGKILKFKNHLDLKVTGVVRDMPATSSLQCEFLTSFSTIQVWLGKAHLDNWDLSMYSTYVLLENDASVQPFYEAHLLDIPLTRGERVHFQPMRRIHLYSQRDYGIDSNGNINEVYGYFVIAILVLFVACINFTNLATAQSLQRATEVGLRKVVGAQKRQLIVQHLGEAVSYVFLALVLAICLLDNFSLTQDVFATGATLSPSDWEVMSVLWVFGLLIGIAAGLYPAFVISSYPPDQILKREFSVRSRSSFRNFLVIVQFTVLAMLLVGTFITNDQISFLRNQNPGFNAEQAMVVPLRSGVLRKNPEPVKGVLRKHPNISHVSSAGLLPGGPMASGMFRVNRRPEIRMDVLWVDYDFIETLGVDLVAGRDFSRAFAGDQSEAFILNETAVRNAGYESPRTAIDQPIQKVSDRKIVDRGSIVGVVKDFNFKSFKRRISPLVIRIKSWPTYLLIKCVADDVSETIESVKSTMQSFDAENPFEYSFLDQRFDAFFHREEKQKRLFSQFSILAIFVGAIGMFGLSFYAANVRRREVGVRKVFGASEMNLLIMLGRETLGLILVANAIAWPIAYLVMQSWLENFAYRIDLDLGPFLLAICITIALGIVTISYQSLRLVCQNPVVSLRNE